MADPKTEEKLLSKRALHTLSFDNFRRYYAPQVRLDPYHAVTNPQGYIDLGTAENKLVEDLIHEKIQEPHIQKVEKYMHYYFEYHGMTRMTIADFLKEQLKANQEISPDNIIVTSGVGAALDLLAYTLADPGECFLSPTPYYTRIKTDMGERSEIEVLDVHLSSQENFRLTVEKLNDAYQDASLKGLVVKGIVLINPHNPLGYIYSKELIMDILNWAKSLKLHVIMDEIYALSVWDPEAEFVSVAALDSLPDSSRTHLLWGFSKDFSLSGFRTGVLYSWNNSVINTIKSIMYFAAVPAIIQYKLQSLLQDKEWLDTVYLPANISLLREAFNVMKGELEKLSVPYVVPQSGFFVWVDLRQYIQTLTSEAEMELFHRIFAEKVYIEPAKGFYSNQIGWFRICYGYPKHWVQEGMGRLGEVLKAMEGTIHRKRVEATPGIKKIEESSSSQSEGSDSLEALLGCLRHSIRSSNWLSNTVVSGSTWADENPKDAEKYKKALEDEKGS